MRVSCPQCGASVDALTESRFYRCPFCASSFVVRGGKGVTEYTFRHVRDDRQAWSALSAYLERGMFTEPVERIAVDYLAFPFWMLSRNGDRRTLTPALEHPFPEIDFVTLPAGDLVFLSDDDDYPKPSVSMEEAAERGPEGDVKGTWSLVSIPLYFLTCRAAGQDYTAIVSGPDGRVFALGYPVPTGSSLMVRHVAMIAFFTILLMVEGLLIRGHLVRAGSFLLSFAVFYGVYRIMLKRELPS